MSDFRYHTTGLLLYTVLLYYIVRVWLGWVKHLLVTAATLGYKIFHLSTVKL